MLENWYRNWIEDKNKPKIKNLLIFLIESNFSFKKSFHFSLFSFIVIFYNTVYFDHGPGMLAWEEEFWQ